MKTNTLAVLAGAAAVTVALAALLVNRNRDATAPALATGRLFPDLPAKVNDVAAVVIQQPGKTLTLQRDEKGGWGVAEKGGYAAQFEKVKQLVVGVAELRESEPKTTRPEYYSQIGVQDVTPEPAPPPAPSPGTKPDTPPPAQPTLVTLKDRTGGSLASLIIGTRRPGNPATVFVRKPGEPQSWLAEGSVDPTADPLTWLDTTALNIGRDRVKRVSVKRFADGDETPPLVVERAKPDDPHFAVQGIPQDREVSGPGAGDALGNALSYYTFDDVMPAAALAGKDGTAPAKPISTTVVEMFDGLVITINAATLDGKTVTTIAASCDASLAPPGEAAPKDEKAPAASAPDATAKDGVTPADSKLPSTPTSIEAVKKEAADLNARLGSWAFVIAEYRAKTLNTKLDELLKPLPTADAQQGPQAPGPQAPNMPPPDEDPADSILVPPK